MSFLVMTTILPTEILENVLSYLDNQSLQHIRFVNKAFNKMALDRLFCRIMLYGTFEDIKVKAEHISQIVDKYQCKGIKELSIASTEFQHCGQHQFLNALLYSLVNMKLHKLMLMQPSVITKDQLQLILFSHPLKELSCAPFLFDEEVTWILLKYGHSLSNLSLDISNMPILQVIPKLSSCMTRLTHLDLYNGSLSTYEISKLLTHFNLKCLTLNEIEISGHVASNSFKLDLLRIDCCAINSNSFYSLFNPRKFIVEDSKLISCNFSSMTRLEILILNQTSLNQLQSCQIGNSRVHKLRFSHVSLPQGSISTFLQNTRLSSFDLDHVKCIDTVPIEKIKKMSSLKYLRFGLITPSFLQLSDIDRFLTLGQHTTFVLSNTIFIEGQEAVKNWIEKAKLPHHLIIS